MFGDFVKAPMDLLCNDLATPSARIAAIMFFDWNFTINKHGNYEVKAKPVQIDAVATSYGINKTTFRSRIQKCKEAGLIDCDAKNNGKESKIIINAKVHKLVRVWMDVEDLAAKKSLKKAEKAKKEATIEEEEQQEEIKTVETDNGTYTEIMNKETGEKIVSVLKDGERGLKPLERLNLRKQQENNLPEDFDDFCNKITI